MTDAIKSIRPALENFYASLTDEQKARFNMMGPPPQRGWCLLGDTAQSVSPGFGHRSSGCTRTRLSTQRPKQPEGSCLRRVVGRPSGMRRARILFDHRCNRGHRSSNVGREKQTSATFLDQPIWQEVITCRVARRISQGYEPALTASTKDLGDRVEIRIRDKRAVSACAT